MRESFFIKIFFASHTPTFAASLLGDMPLFSRCVRFDATA
jgi:hypothetical protein